MTKEKVLFLRNQFPFEEKYDSNDRDDLSLNERELLKIRPVFNHQKSDFQEYHSIFYLIRVKFKFLKEWNFQWLEIDASIKTWEQILLPKI